MRPAVPAITGPQEDPAMETLRICAAEVIYQQ